MTLPFIFVSQMRVLLYLYYMMMTRLLLKRILFGLRNSNYYSAITSKKKRIWELLAIFLVTRSCVLITVTITFKKNMPMISSLVWVSLIVNLLRCLLTQLSSFVSRMLRIFMMLQAMNWQSCILKS